MRRKIILLCSILFLAGLGSLKAQKYISNRQSYIAGNSTEATYLDNTRIVLITGDKFGIELPDNTLLKGTLTLISDETKDGKRVQAYKTDKGCILVINEDNIFLNLYKTHEVAYTYYLDNYVKPHEPTEEEKQNSEYNFNVKFYGKFSADCIKEGKVKPGIDGSVVLEILGIPKTINQTETENMISEQLVYDNMYVYLENGIVTAIQRRMEIK